VPVQSGAQHPLLPAVKKRAVDQGESRPLADASPALGPRNPRTAAALLQSLGVTEPVAAEIAAAGERLRRRMQRMTLPVEFGAMFDLATGHQIGTIATGIGKEVDVTAQLRQIRAGRSYLALHTHPGNTPFSLLDVKTFLENPTISAAAVVTLGGRWFVMSRRPDAQANADVASLTLIARTYARLRPGYKAAVDLGTMTEERALASLLHHVWLEIAGTLGLRYHWSR